jgi:hypothetical protein
LAKATPSGSPTYPSPMIAIVLLDIVKLNLNAKLTKITS